VKTLAEIEAAVESLPKDKQEELLRFIESRLRNGAATSSQPGIRGRIKRNFPVSKGREPFTSADVKRIESESDATQ
jgi:hypothetical protein